MNNTSDHSFPTGPAFYESRKCKPTETVIFIHENILYEISRNKGARRSSPSSCCLQVVVVNGLKETEGCQGIQQ